VSGSFVAEAVCSLTVCGMLMSPCDVWVGSSGVIISVGELRIIVAKEVQGTRIAVTLGLPVSFWGQSVLSGVHPHSVDSMVLGTFSSTP
jgi:hypothetical protein